MAYLFKINKMIFNFSSKFQYLKNLLNYFIYLHFKYCPPYLSPFIVLYSIFHPVVYERVVTHPPTAPHQSFLISHSSQHPPSLGHHVSKGLDAFSPTKARQISSLLHKCQGPRTSSCMLFGLWLSLWEL